MEITAKLLLSSKNSVTGVTLHTFLLTYPRCILAEFNTHRMLSRNTSSSRAIPSSRQRRAVLSDPFIPTSVGQNKKGMQAGEELTGWRRKAAIEAWKLSRYPAALASWGLENLGAHKQIVNRLLEPWAWVQQVVTATDFNNFFKLRTHADAEPHFRELAEQMEAKVLGATPQVLKPGKWHLPFVSEEDLPIETLKKISVARCARTSYWLFDGVLSTVEDDERLCNRLLTSGHWSPFEHVATPTRSRKYIGNFQSWNQYRKEFIGEDGGGSRRPCVCRRQSLDYASGANSRVFENL
jgi:hypothetical protein